MEQNLDLQNMILNTQMEQSWVLGEEKDLINELLFGQNSKDVATKKFSENNQDDKGMIFVFTNNKIFSYEIPIKPNDPYLDDVRESYLSLMEYYADNIDEGEIWARIELPESKIQSYKEHEYESYKASIGRKFSQFGTKPERLINSRLVIDGIDDKLLGLDSVFFQLGKGATRLRCWLHSSNQKYELLNKSYILDKKLANYIEINRVEKKELLSVYNNELKAFENIINNFEVELEKNKKLNFSVIKGYLDKLQEQFKDIVSITDLLKERNILRIPKIEILDQEIKKIQDILENIEEDNESKKPNLKYYKDQLDFIGKCIKEISIENNFENTINEFVIISKFNITNHKNTVKEKDIDI